MPATVTNPDDKDGAGCKHVLNVLSNLEWAVKLATVINNYIIYMDKHMHDKYVRFIQPQLFDDLDKAGILDNTVVVIYGDHDAKLKESEYEYKDNWNIFRMTFQL